MVGGERGEIYLRLLKYFSPSFELLQSISREEAFLGGADTLWLAGRNLDPVLLANNRLNLKSKIKYTFRGLEK